MPNSNEDRRKNAPVGGHGPAATRPVEKAKDFGGTLRKLIGALKDFRLQIAAVVLFVIASVVLSIISPKLLGSITTRLLTTLWQLKLRRHPGESTRRHGAARGNHPVGPQPDDGKTGPGN